MSNATSNNRRNVGADLFELLGSMRFAVSLLMFICVASLIGTVLQQNQAFNSYIDQFGPFWFALFDVFGLWHVYNSWWFLIIMSFLVVSTSICLLRNAPKMVRDMRSFREYVRGSSLRAFHHRAEAENVPLTVDDSTRRWREWFGRNGYRVKEREDGENRLLAAKKGSANRLGYIFAHAAIVIICIGGILDSDLPIKLQMWLGDKTPITQNMLISDVPSSGRLSPANISFRANMLLPEGSQSSTGIIAAGQGVLLQPLPFSIKLDRFDIDYYSTGMPSSFKSYVEVTDPDTGKTFKRLIEVNEPLRYKGVTVYQSSFDDGGSHVDLTAYPLDGSPEDTFDVSGTVGNTVDVTLNAKTDNPQKLTLDLSALRVINVENFGDDGNPQPQAVMEHVAAVTGSATSHRNKNLRNVGPSIQYRLTGADGQSHEFQSYMLPMMLDDMPVFLMGVRNNPAESYRYLRIPADADNSVKGFMQLRAALQNPELRARAAAHFAEKNAVNPGQRPLLEKAADGALQAFARGGFDALVENVPEAERERFLSFTIPTLQLSLAELQAADREQRGLPPLDLSGKNETQHTRWIQQALLTLGSMAQYPAPVFLTLKNFKHVQASVFQIARSPGKNTVYLGCLLLVLGVFSMFYIRDRRIWVWIRPQDAGSQWLAAMTSQRRNLDFNHEFERFKEAFKRLSS